MNTFMANKNSVERKWFIIDASGKPLGRVAALAASILIGKHKAIYTPHVDCGDYVVVINAQKAVLSGKKLQQKEWIRHTGWIGNLKRVKYADLMEKNPEKAMSIAVWGMIPHNSLGRDIFKKLKVCSGSEHCFQAQKPVLWEESV